MLILRNYVISEKSEIYNNKVNGFPFSREGHLDFNQNL
jgi:hypothetical protein